MQINPLFIDFETRSELDIKKVGAFKYFEHPSTDILVMSYAQGVEEPQLWMPAMLNYKPLLERLTKTNTRLFAWNATFEMLCWQFLMHKKYGYPALPDAIWHDIQAVSVSKGYPADLKEAAKAINSTYEKDGSGTRLINFFSKPNKNELFNDPSFHKEKFKDLCRYCMQDVRTTRAIGDKLGYVLPDQERRIWLHTVQINRRGVNIDSSTCRNVVTHIDAKKQQLNNSITMLTGGEITAVTQRERIRNYIASEYSLILPDMQGTTLAPYLADDAKIPFEAKTLLKWYVQGNKSSVAKYNKMLTMLCKDRTIKGFLFYHAAGTGRYGGRGVQFQNFPNKTHDNAEEIVDCLHAPELEMVEMFVGDIFDVSKQLLRAVIIAPSGKYLCVADYKSIEAVASAWACRETEILQGFIKGLDQYKVMAAKMYGVAYDAVDSDKRFAGKIAVLACGYGGSTNAILGMAEKMGMDVPEDQAFRWVGQFRSARPALVNAWRDAEQAARQALTVPEGRLIDVNSVRGMAFRRIGDDLRLVMPSGREINYPLAYIESEIREKDYGTGIKYKHVVEMKAKWVDSKIHKWQTRSLYGSLFFQNYIQGLCRDILTNAQLNLESSGFAVNINVHDELGSIVDDNSDDTFKKFKNIMTRRPLWLSADFPILADGYIARRYRK